MRYVTVWTALRVFHDADSRDASLRKWKLYFLWVIYQELKAEESDSYQLLAPSYKRNGFVAISYRDEKMDKHLNKIITT